MANPFLGEIRIFGFNFAPRGWALCNGQLLPIDQYQALFALLGTTYGGNGQTTFALPNLQSRVAIHQGQGSGLSSYVIGQAGGTENVTLTQNTMPQHSHSAIASDTNASVTRPGNAVLGRVQTAIYDAAPDGTVMNSGMIGATGGGQPFQRIPPYLVPTLCIALEGIFPSRN